MGKGPGEESGLGPSEHERRGTPFERAFFLSGGLGIISADYSSTGRTQVENPDTHLACLPIS
jgi:hypothetical protein